MASPLVTVICLCYNQERFVKRAIESVWSQTYTNVQLIVVDDASTDGSKKVVEDLAKQDKAFEFISLEENVGNCSAFNRGLARAKGEYLIDLAADDILLATRIESGVASLQRAGNEYGVHFSDAEMISENGEHLGIHSKRFPHQTIPQGNIYKELISRYFICPASMMFTREVMDDLNGYDETLLYEDFDFWIRSSRKFKYLYEPAVLVQKRLTSGGLGTKQFRLFSKHSSTTFRVCEKILDLNQTEEEQRALAKRIRYEIRLNVRLLNGWMVWKFWKLLRKNAGMQYA